MDPTEPALDFRAMPMRPIKTDEPFDRVYSRPAARVIVWFAAKTPITPNQLTIIATLFGLGIGVCLAFREGAAAAACILGYLAFDCADGQLARLRGSTGYLGRAVDGIGDYISAIAMHLGLGVWLGREQGWAAGFAWAITAGFAAAWASFLLDRYKRRYRGDMDDVDAIRAEADATPGYRGRMIASMIPYCRRLEGGVRVPDLPAYQERVRPAMILWLLNGPTMHFLLMAFLFVFEEPLLYTWIALGPMNLLSIISLAVQVRLERRDPTVITRGAIAGESM